MIILASCNNSQSEKIVKASLLSNDNPDSALAILKTIDKKNLSDKELAWYALIFTKSQDKSGLNVDNDSLIGISYDWYSSRPTDSLYATCQYYMGKYYLLNDSDENAIECFKEAIKASMINKDTSLACLSLEKASRALYLSEPGKALNYAKKASELYSKLHNSTMKNRIYYNLNISNCYAFLNNPRKAVSIAKTNLHFVDESGNSDVISDIYKDLSSFYQLIGNNDSCLYYAKMAYKYGLEEDNSLIFSLATSYLGVDSLKQAYSLLRKVKPKNLSDKYAVYYNLSRISMLENNMESVRSFADSADIYLGQMYKGTLNAKEKYFSILLQNTKEKEIIEKKSLFHRTIFIIFILISFFIMVILIIIYKEKKNRLLEGIKVNEEKNKMKLDNERKLFEKEKQMTEKLHQEEISHKEIQLSVMRNYLMKKVEVVNKLEEKLKSRNKHLHLSDDDWIELEVFLNGVDNSFVIRFRKSFPNMEEKDVRLMMLLRLRLPQKVLADIYCISEKAIKQKLYLYKAKVGLNDSKKSLRDFIETF